MKNLLVLLVVALGLSGCAVKEAVLGEPAEVGPQIEALESRHPVVTDLALVSGERIRFARSDGRDLGFSFANDGGRANKVHKQVFVPVDGYLPEDVVAEILGLAEGSGWEIWENSRGSHCGRPFPPQDAPPFDTLKVSVGPVGALRDQPEVIVSFGGPRSCNFENKYTIPWEG